MAFSFFGGVHPKENKWYACDKETQVFPEPDIVVIPMSQHIGAPCNPLVKKGDPVTVGQKTVRACPRFRLRYGQGCGNARPHQRYHRDECGDRE